MPKCIPFSDLGDKLPNKSHLRKAGFTSAHSLRTVHPSGHCVALRMALTMGQERGVFGHIVFNQELERINFWYTAHFLPFHLV